MRLNEEQRKTAYIALSCLFLIATLVVLQVLKPGRAKRTEAQPILLSTNELKVGAKLFNLSENTKHVFTVVEVDRAYDFPDGDIRPGVRIRSEVLGRSTWVPRENLNKFHVVQ
jgi:hypothetical protein